MKKLFSIIFALLLVVSITGVVSAHQATYDPQTTSGGAYISVPVYNNSGSSMDPGMVVVWDVDASTGDNDVYVTTTTTADTGLVAGVIWPSTIAASSSGSMVIWGLAECNLSTSGAGEATPLCTSTTAGGGDMCASGAGPGMYAITSTSGVASAQVGCFVTR